MAIDTVREQATRLYDSDLMLSASMNSKFFVIKYDYPTEFEATVYDPVFCLILQGKKETLIGNRTVNVGEGQLLIVSHDLPVTSRITQASTACPYLALVVPINMETIRNLYTEISEPPQSAQCNSLEVSIADNAFLDALERYLDVQANPNEISVLEPLILKEIHYRLLVAPNGGALHQMLVRDSHSSRISKVISVIRRDYKTMLSVPDLAKVAGMSQSSFHERFKSIIGTTPLQYQKDLRLIEARKLLSQGQHSVACTAYEVGYESPAQFSREYSRKYNCSPVQHLVRETVLA